MLPAGEALRRALRTFFRNWHLNSKALRKLNRRLCRLDSLSDGTHARRNFLDLFSAAEFEADTSIAACVSIGGQHEIAKPRKAGHRFATSSAGKHEPRHLCEPACDKCSRGIRTQPQPISDAGGYRNRVLHGAAEFDARSVGIRVEPESRR